MMKNDLTTKVPGGEKDQQEEKKDFLSDLNPNQPSGVPTSPLLAESERLERSSLRRSSSNLGSSSSLGNSQSPLRDSRWLKDLPTIGSAQMPEWPSPSRSSPKQPAPASANIPVPVVSPDTPISQTKGTIMRYFRDENLIENDETKEKARQGDFDYGVEGDGFGGVELKGPRRTQEDRMFAHKLTEEEARIYATLGQEQRTALLQVVTQELNQQLEEKYKIANKAGATGMIAIIEPSPIARKCEVVVANLGDSQLLVVDPQANTIKRQNTLHNPMEPSELKRMQDADPKHFKLGYGGRLLDGLAVSRSFGDFYSHMYGLSGEPEVTYEKYSLPEEGELLFIAACDGLADEGKHIPERVLEDLLKYARSSADKGENLRKLAHHLAEKAVIDIPDNISLEIVRVTAETKTTPIILGIFDGHSVNGIDGATIAEFLRVKWAEVFTKHLLNSAQAVPVVQQPTPVLQTTVDPTQAQPSAIDVSANIPVPAVSPVKLMEENHQEEENLPPSPSKMTTAINRLMDFLRQKKLWVSISLALGLAYGNFLPLLMWGAINLMPVVMAVSFYACLYGVQALRDSYRHYCADKFKANSTQQPLSKELSEALELGERSAENYTAQLKACVSPKLWFYPSYQQAYYAGQLQTEEEKAPANDNWKNNKRK